MDEKKIDVWIRQRNKGLFFRLADELKGKMYGMQMIYE